MSVIWSRKGFTRFYLRHAFKNAVVVVETLWRYLPAFQRSANSAARVGIVFAVAEFATAQIVTEFDKTARDLLRLQMPQAELTYARRVDDIATVGEVIQASGGGRVLTQSRRIGHVIDQNFGVVRVEQGIKQARFADAGLPGEDTDAASQRGFQLGKPLLGMT